MQSVRAGVAGAGVFGGHHARKYHQMKDVALTAVFDVDQTRAQALAGDGGAAAFDDYDAFLDAVDVVSITSPATTHADYGARAAAAGRHVYMEKPLATSARAAAALVDDFSAAGLVLHVGHQERFVLEALGVCGAGPWRSAEFLRVGPPSGRCGDVSCVFDLMIHDLDFAVWLGVADGAPTDVAVCGDADETIATLTFANDTSASFIASRVREAPGRRTILKSVAGEDTEIDFLAKTRRCGEAVRAFGMEDVPSIADPLGASLANFVAACRGEAQSHIAGATALGAVRLAEAVENAREAVPTLAASLDEAFA